MDTTQVSVNSIKNIILILAISLIIVFLLSNYTEDILKTGYSVHAERSVTPYTSFNYRSVTPHTSSNYSGSPLIFLSDNSNIPIVDYGWVNGIYIGPQRNPLTISRTASEYYNSYIRAVKIGSDSTAIANAKQSLINNANWLVDNAVYHGNYSTLEYRFPWPIYELKTPWRSGMAQADAIQALINAHEVTGDKKYLDNAKMLLNSFFVEVKDGGVTYKTPTEGWWYEGYAGVGAKESRDINGMIIAVLGIHKYYEYTNDTDAKYLFDQGVLALKKNIAHYDYKEGYSYYDSLGNLSPLMYHKRLIEFTERLYDITKEDTFKFYHDRWKDFKIPA